MTRVTRSNEKRRALFLGSSLGLHLFTEGGGWVYSIPSLPANVQPAKVVAQGWSAALLEMERRAAREAVQ